MIARLLPFTLIASLAVPFIAHAKPTNLINRMTPEDREKFKAKSRFQRIVLAAILKNRTESNDTIEAFLNAIKAESKKINESTDLRLLPFIARELPIEVIEQLEKEYLPALEPLDISQAQFWTNAAVILTVVEKADAQNTQK